MPKADIVLMEVAWIWGQGRRGFKNSKILRTYLMDAPERGSAYDSAARCGMATAKEKEEKACSRYFSGREGAPATQERTVYYILQSRRWQHNLQASDSSYLCPVFLASTLKSHNVLLGTSKDRMCPITSIHRLNAEGQCYLHVWVRYNCYKNHKNLALRTIDLLLIYYQNNYRAEKISLYVVW